MAETRDKNPIVDVEEEPFETIILPKGEVISHEQNALAQYGDPNIAKKLAARAKRHSLTAFFVSFGLVVFMGIAEPICKAFGIDLSGGFYEEAFSMTKTICTYLLGFAFSSKLDDFLK